MGFELYILRDYWPVLAQGFVMTLFIVVTVLLSGIVIGALVASLTLSPRRAVARAGRIYVNGFRNIPEMVLIFWAYFCLPQLIDINLSALTTGVLALSLVAGANLAEIFRAGVQGVPVGQTEAARALGLRRFPLWGRVILPQAIRNMLAPMINYLTDIFKHSTLLSTIGVGEMAHAAFLVGGQTFHYLELFSAIGVVFFLCIFPLSVLARILRARIRGA